jgi:hypothetical protein
MEAHDRIAVVVRTAKKLRQLRLCNLAGNLGDLRRRLVQSLFTLFIFGYVEKEARLLEAGLMLLPRADDFLKRGLFLENRLGFFAVVPKIRT